ncbi:MAG: phosphoribosylformylglycinamidine synthase [Alphaproteobacteria bacterium]|nr:phosphoribosylformylglycinamidine synthase [Alphaproteobacteria bacterium]|tara:strand:+ start:13205 stop:16111 length:2907 start_codon:yes stop_codon:yes gene_type:complete
MAYRTEVLTLVEDGRAQALEKSLQAHGLDARINVIDVYSSENETVTKDTFINSVCNPVTQAANQSHPDFDWALEIGFLPGVTDNIGHTAQELIELAGAQGDTACYSAKLYLIKGNNLQLRDIEKIAASLSNSLIQRITIKTADEFKADGGMGITIPKVTLSNQGSAADQVDLNVSDEALSELGQKGIKNEDGSYRGPLGLSLHYMKAIQAYYKDLGRNPTDIELETLAQTWSEHCKHTIFASPIDEVKDGLYKHYIKRATKEIREARGDDDFCVSVFSDNAGGIIFDDNYLITDKVETHNSPSALDPFGGAITGIVGVNRDCIGFGQGAKPVINRYGYCFADPRTSPELYRDKNRNISILSPETIMNGVIAGVESGGNCSGIPTPQGFAYFDDRFVGKPLVFVGTIGLIPRTINGKPGHEKQAQPGDKIVMAGGRVGRDGIHGATFSSVALDEGSPATAVQIGDPITQKKMSDAIIKEIRDLGLYSAITDNGAGGLSSSVGEMAEQSGGFHLELEKVPLKYPGMAPWEIWISESQERMTMAVPPENTDEIIALLAKRGVEAAVVGTYTDSGNAHITYNDETIMDMAMEFLHDGNPETPLETTFTRGGEDEPSLPEPSDYAQELQDMLGRLNICSKEFIATQYDHNVQGSAVLGPLQGKGRVYAETSVTKPVLDSPKGVVLSQGLAPRYSDIDTYHMSTASLDMAVRNAVAAGVDIEQLALLDNFCWCSSDEAERLGQLKRSVEAIYDMAVTYKTPFISGKDSMFNDFKGFDKDGNPVKISAPPTLLVSSIGVMPNVDQSISLAPKAAGDLVYLLGETKDELGGSEYYDQHGKIGSNVPESDAKKNLYLYQLYSRAARKRLISSAIAVNHGGLGVALAKKAIAGGLGMDIDLSHIDLRADKALFSETTGRILITVAPHNKEAFEKLFKKYSFLYQIGHIAYTDTLNIKNVATCDIDALETAYKAPLKDY